MKNKIQNKRNQDKIAKTQRVFALNKFVIQKNAVKDDEIVCLNFRSKLNVSVNFTNLWNSVANPSDYLKYKIRNITNVCFILANTQTNWAQAPLSTSLAVHRLNFTSGYQTGCNNVSVDLSVEVPGDEISGNKNSNITFISSLGELGYGAD